MDPKQAFMQGILPPVVATLVMVLIAWRPWKRQGAPNGYWGSALGIAIGYAVADFLIRGFHGDQLKLFPRGGSLWHPYIALASGILIAVLSSYKKIGARLPVSILLTAAAAAIYFRVPLIDNWRDTLPALAIATGAGFAMWFCVWSAAHNARGARVPLMLWAAATVSALILAQSHNAALAQLSGALAASMGVFVLLGWLRPQIPAIAGAIPVYILVMLGLLIVAREFARPWKQADWALVLAACAVASPAITHAPPFRKLRPFFGTLLAVILTLALGAAGLALTEDAFDFSGFR